MDDSKVAGVCEMVRRGGNRGRRCPVARQRDFCRTCGGTLQFSTDVLMGFLVESCPGCGSRLVYNGRQQVEEPFTSRIELFTREMGRRMRGTERERQEIATNLRQAKRTAVRHLQHLLDRRRCYGTEE